MKRAFMILVALLVFTGCHFAEYVTPKTGPGTPYHCARADSQYCGGDTCCRVLSHCAGTDRCDEDDYQGNTEWIGAKRSFPREKAIQ